MKEKKNKKTWAERCRQTLLSLPVFWHYFIPMGIILVLSAAIQLSMSFGYTHIMADSYMHRTEASFLSDGEELSASLYDIYSVPSILEATTDYQDLLQVQRGELPATVEALALSGLRSTFENTIRYAGFADEVEYFVYFPDIDAAFTPLRLFPDPERCFEAYLRYGEKTGEETLQHLKNSKGAFFLPHTTLADGDGKPCVTAILRYPQSSAVMGIVWPEDTILKFFGAEQMPQNAYFRMEDLNGNVLLAKGEAAENCHEVSCAIRGFRCRAIMGVPQDYFLSLAAPTRNAGFALLLLTVFVGLGLSILFSNAGTLPLRRLLSSYSVEENSSETRNEIYRLAELLASSQQAEQAVSRILSINVLTRVLSGGVLTKKEEDTLNQAYPILSAPCRIAIVHTADAVEEFGQTAVTELLQEHLPENFACSTVNNLETGVLFPDDPDALSALASVLDGVNHQLQMDGIMVQCGVSAPFVGGHSAYAAVRQARFSIPIRETSFIEVYSAEENGDDRPGVFSWLTHEKLYRAVIKNDCRETVEFIRGLGADKYYSAADAKEVFYNVRFVIRATAGEMTLPLPEADVLEYREELRPKDNFRTLEELAQTLFDRLNARKETNAKNALDAVVGYIKENFRRADISAASVATHFSLPVKTVYAAVRDKTGQGFNEYLIELRMKAAAQLLCTTQRPVDEIGAECGYPAQSTFYRVFKNYYGESPAKYRSLN